MVALKSADIEKFVTRPDAARPVVLIFGADAGLVRERAEKILKASVENFDDPFSLVRGWFRGRIKSDLEKSSFNFFWCKAPM